MTEDKEERPIEIDPVDMLGETEVQYDPIELFGDPSEKKEELNQIKEALRDAANELPNWTD